MYTHTRIYLRIIRNYIYLFLGIGLTYAQCQVIFSSQDIVRTVETVNETYSSNNTYPILPNNLNNKTSFTINNLTPTKEYKVFFYHRLSFNQSYPISRFSEEHPSYLDSYIRVWVDKSGTNPNTEGNFSLSGHTSHNNNWLQSSYTFQANQNSHTLNFLGVDQIRSWEKKIYFDAVHDKTDCYVFYDDYDQYGNYLGRFCGELYEDVCLRNSDSGYDGEDIWTCKDARYRQIRYKDFHGIYNLDIAGIIVFEATDTCDPDNFLLANQTSFCPQAGKYVLSGWVKENVSSSTTSYIHSVIEVFVNGSEVETFTPKGAIIDGWQKIEGVFDIPSNGIHLDINLKNNYTDGSTNVYFDDIRVHPFDGNMKSFVYDPVSQRLMAELDENNYATFYEYDQEGGLVRVKKETERGIQTIQETRSATKINTSN